MKKLLYVPVLFILFVFIFSCSTKQVEVQPPQNLKTINDNIKITFRGEMANTALLDEFERYLKAKLIIAGFNPTQDDTDCINLNVHIKDFMPGSQSARILIGFGAGRGSLIYSAQFITTDGTILADINGQERFTGADVEYNLKYGSTTGFGGPEVVQNVLCQEAAEHITEVAMNKPSPN